MGQKQLIQPIRLFRYDPPIRLFTRDPLRVHPILSVLNQGLEFIPSGRCDLPECPDETSHDGPMTEEHPRQIELTRAKANRFCAAASGSSDGRKELEDRAEEALVLVVV